MNISNLLRISLPIIQAPMAGSQDAELAIAVCKAGGLGSLPCASISIEKVRTEVAKIRSETKAPFNLNFFCHKDPIWDEAREEEWKSLLKKYYQEFQLDVEMDLIRSQRNPFNEEACQLVEEVRPPVVSFHFGLPDPQFIQRIKNLGTIILSSATTVDEARWLEQHGCDVIIAQGIEAGGHRGIFLTNDLSTQTETMTLLKNILKVVKLPVVAAGGIADAEMVKACMKLGASGVQVGTAYLFSHEAKVSPIHKQALLASGPKPTALTNLFTGRPARGIMNRLMREIGPMNHAAPEFPLAGGRLAPLKLAAEKKGLTDFSNLWAGQSVEKGRVASAEEITRELMK